MVAVPSLLLFKKVVNWGLTPQAINFAQSAFMGHRVCFTVPVDFMNEYFTWTRASGEVRPTGRFVAAPTTIANLPTFATVIERCLGAPYTDLDGVATALNYSSSALDCTDDMKRDPAVQNATWNYSSLPASVAVSAPAATHYGANDLVMAFVLNKCFGSSSFDAYDVVYNLDDGFGMLTSEQLAGAINLSMQEEEDTASLCVLPAKALAAQLPGDNKGQVDAMFRSLLSIDAQRFHKNGRQITGLFETNTDADASGNWCLAVGDKIEVPVKLYFRAPVTVLSVVDGAKNASSATPDQVETVFIKGEAAALDAHDAAQAAAADRGNVMAIRLQLVCGAPAISPPSTRSSSEDHAALLQVVNQSSLIFYKGIHYPTQNALGVVAAGGVGPYTYSYTAAGTYDQVTLGSGLTGPPGVAISSSGLFTFDPTGLAAAAGRWKVNLTITDSAATPASVTTDIYISVEDSLGNSGAPPPGPPPGPNILAMPEPVSFNGVTIAHGGIMSTYTQATIAGDFLSFNPTSVPGTWSMGVADVAIGSGINASHNTVTVDTSSTGTNVWAQTTDTNCKLHLCATDPNFPPASTVTFVVTRTYQGVTGTYTVVITMPLP